MTSDPCSTWIEQAACACMLLSQLASGDILAWLKWGVDTQHHKVQTETRNSKLQKMRPELGWDPWLCWPRWWRSASCETEASKAKVLFQIRSKILENQKISKDSKDRYSIEMQTMYTCIYTYMKEYNICAWCILCTISIFCLSKDEKTIQKKGHVTQVPWRELVFF